MEGERPLHLLTCLDLTRLQADDDEGAVRRFCASASTPYGSPAALCIQPQWVALADRTLDELGLRSRVRVATVANFPGGDQDPEQVSAVIQRALDDGADEIDIVLPWREVAQRRCVGAARLLDDARARCTGKTLKVILETGALQAEAIDRAADLALDHGADFLKTSTGLHAVGATLDAAGRLLDRIRARGVDCGLKVSGGIRSVEQAEAYRTLCEARMGTEWPTPERFRIGASGLFDALLQALAEAEPDGHRA